MAFARLCRTVARAPAARPSCSRPHGEKHRENVELAVIAQRLVQEAVRRASCTTATPHRRTSRCRRPHHLRHRRQDRLAGLGLGDQATRQLGQVIAAGSRVAAQQRECIVHRHLETLGEGSLGLIDHDPAGQRGVQVRSTVAGVAGWSCRIATQAICANVKPPADRRR